MRWMLGPVCWSNLSMLIPLNLYGPMADSVIPEKFFCTMRKNTFQCCRKLEVRERSWRRFNISFWTSCITGFEFGFCSINHFSTPISRNSALLVLLNAWWNISYKQAIDLPFLLFVELNCDYITNVRVCVCVGLYSHGRASPYSPSGDTSSISGSGATRRGRDRCQGSQRRGLWITSWRRNGWWRACSWKQHTDRAHNSENKDLFC